MIKKVQIPEGQIGFVFKASSFEKILKQGEYWLKKSRDIYKYDMAKQFTPHIELNILLKNIELKSMLKVIELADNEIALLYENNNFKSVLKPGRYAFWKGVNNFTFIKADISKIEIGDDIPKVLLEHPELTPFIRSVSIDLHQKAILYINSKYEKILDKGIYYFWKNSIPISVMKTDMRQQQMEISGQEILTKDKAALRINFFIQYKVVDIEKALNENKDYENQFYILVQLALREFIGTLTLDEILAKKESVSEYVLDTIKSKSDILGLKVNNCGIRDIILPGEIKEIMNQVLIAQKKAQANIIMRREETASTRSLLNTAKIMEENEMLFKLKEMEYVEKIAEKISSISLSGGGQIVEQLRDLFAVKKTSEKNK